jgi:uncharacterized membrane protein
MSSARGTEHDIPDPVHSTAHLFGHPVHPMIMPFPLVFLISAAVTDVVFVVADNPFWADTSLWLLAAGLFTGVVAALAGLIDFVTIERARSHLSGWVHFIGNVIVLMLALGNWLPRIGDPQGFVEPWGLVLSALTVVLLAVTGWTGGELAYRHQIGVMGH